MIDRAHLVVGLVGPLAICIMFIFLGLLSRRLGRVTRSRPYYIGYFAAALLVGISLGVRVLSLILDTSAATRLAENPRLLLVATSLTAVGVTLGVVVTWRYWSWLLAERG